MQLRKLKFMSTAAIAVASICANSTFANSITTPTGLAPGAPFYVVFVSNTTTDASSGLLAYYDNIAQTDADNNGLGTYNSQTLTWRALGSSSHDDTSAEDRLPVSNIPVYLLDGTLVADSVNDLWNLSDGAANAVDEAADGTIVNSKVWTGTTGTGDKASGTLGENPVEYGQSSSTGTGWIDSGSTLASSNKLPIYAFTEVDVPLPSSAVMGTATLGLLAAYAASRKLLKLSK